MKSAAQSGRLKIGILMESVIQPQWVYQVVDDIKQSSIAEISVVLLDSGRGDIRDRTTVFKWWGCLLWRCYESLDRKLLKKGPDPFDDRDLSSMLPECPRLPFSRAADLQKYDLDVVFHSGSRKLSRNELKIAKYGVWSYQHGDPPGFWEVIEKQPTTRMVLRKLTEDGAGAVLGQSWSRTFIYSVYKNKTSVYPKASFLAVRALKNLIDMQVHTLVETAGESPGPSHEKHAGNPSNLEMIHLWIRVYARIFFKVIYNLFHVGQFNLAYQLGETDERPAPIAWFQKNDPSEGPILGRPFSCAQRREVFYLFGGISFYPKEGAYLCH